MFKLMKLAFDFSRKQIVALNGKIIWGKFPLKDLI
jgi:hypothetical protein